jgi:hypothetical protein
VKRIKSFKLFESTGSKMTAKDRVVVLSEVREDIEGILYELEDHLVDCKVNIQSIYLKNEDRFGRSCDDFSSTFHGDDDGNGLMLMVTMDEVEQDKNKDLLERFLRLLKEHLDYVCIGNRIGMSSNRVRVAYTIDLRGYMNKLMDNLEENKKVNKI